MEHAYRDGRGGDITVDGQAVDGTIVLRVIDRGAWRFGSGDPNRARGMHIMRSFVDDVHVERDGRGTTVVICTRGSWSGSTA